MNHLQRKSYERGLQRSVELEARAVALRHEAMALPKRFWHKKRAMRAEASEIMSWVRSLRRRPH